MHEDMIAYWARQRPESIALLGGGTATYRVLDEAINKVAAQLLTLDPPETGLVAVQMGNLFGLHLVERALYRLGLTSVILPPTAPPGDLLELLRPDLFLTYLEANLAAHPKTVLASMDWVWRALNGPVQPPPGRPLRSEDVVRVVISSGTTGLPKKIPVTRASLERRSQILAVAEGLGQSSRLMLAMGPQTISGLVVPNAFWMLGATVIIYDMRRTYEEILNRRPTYMLISTGQLDILLREIPEDAKAIEGFHVTAAGSQVSRTLASQAVRRLSADFWIIYGSTEHSTVTSGHAAVLDRHERAVGYPVPGLAIEAVDTSGAPVAAGKTGILRTRGEGLFPGYLDDEETTSSAFRDGWFYPGDYGSVTADGLVLVEGRIAESINLGGVKIDPGAVDELARTCLGVRDAAAFAVPDEAGLERPWIAVVRDEGFDSTRLAILLRSRWPALRDLKIASIDAIPRNDMVKVERQKLKRMVIDAQTRGVR
jgi:acyl-CoA synthetase (AMP-forming)/AMP-acid ligase II